MRAYIKRSFGRIVTETPFNGGWVDAIKQIVPLSYRTVEGKGCWSFDPVYYTCVKTITEHFHGIAIDSTGGVPEIQAQSWKEKWDVYKELDRKENENYDRFKGNTNSHAQPKSSAFATLFVTENAPKEVITAAYRALSAIHHPDKGGSTEVMARINAAHQELKNKGRA